MTLRDARGPNGRLCWEGLLGASLMASRFLEERTWPIGLTPRPPQQTSEPSVYPQGATRTKPAVSARLFAPARTFFVVSAASMESPMSGKKMAHKSPHTGPSINKTSGAALVVRRRFRRFYSNSPARRKDPGRTKGSPRQAGQHLLACA